MSGSTVPNSTIEVPVKFEFTITWWREIDVTSRSAAAGAVPAIDGQQRSGGDGEASHHSAPSSRIE